MFRCVVNRAFYAGNAASTFLQESHSRAAKTIDFLYGLIQVHPLGDPYL